MIDFIGEIVVELFAYSTYGIMDRLMGKLPIRWNKRVRKFICVLLSVVLWIGLFYIVIKILEEIL